MKKIEIQTLIEDCDYPTAGRKLYDEMVRTIAQGDQLVVDMTGVDCLPSLFLNTSLGSFLERFGSDSIKGKLLFENITASQVGRIKDYVSRF